MPQDTQGDAKAEPRESEAGWMRIHMRQVTRAEAQAQDLQRLDHALITSIVAGAPAFLNGSDLDDDIARSSVVGHF